jgi:hypothetical protein
LHDDYPPTLVLITAGFFLTSGAVLIRSAEWFVRLAYGPAQPPTSVFS